MINFHRQLRIEYLRPLTVQIMYKLFDLSGFKFKTFDKMRYKSSGQKLLQVIIISYKSLTV